MAASWAQSERTEIPMVFSELFRRPRSDETIRGWDETIRLCACSGLETQRGYQLLNDSGGTADDWQETSDADLEPFPCSRFDR
ncbi:hypothetical protein CKO39_00760 [Rhodopseudomonas palustris]|nr:hypothetical protein CKO39_00760 [Rhodopseudomonas palustris]